MEDRPSEIVLPAGAAGAREASRGYSETDEAALALLHVIRRVDQQLPAAPELTGAALAAQRTFTAIAADLAVRDFERPAVRGV